MKKVRYEEIHVKVKGDNLEVHTEFGPASSVDVIGGKLYVFSAIDIKKDDFFDFVDGIGKMEKLTDEDIEWLIQELKSKNK